MAEEGRVWGEIRARNLKSYAPACYRTKVLCKVVQEAQLIQVGRFVLEGV